VVLALVLVGGQYTQNTHKDDNDPHPSPGYLAATATPGASRIIRDPALLYTAGERVSFMAALENEIAAPESVSSVESAAPVVIAAGPLVYGQATAYGPAYNGQVLGCGTGYYDTNDMTILAVGPDRYAEWPCGTPVQVCGEGGCIVATRQDACPGCYANLVDLSEAGNAAVCGGLPHTCRVTLQRVTWQ
jgi:hypothetical protein